MPRSERLAERTIVVVDDGFARAENGTVLPHTVPRTQAAELRALCGLRDAAKALLEAEAATRDDTQAIAGLRAELNRRYDAYVDAYGPVNRCSFREVGRPDEAGERRLAQFRPPRGGFAKDPFAGVVDALEISTPKLSTPAKPRCYRVVSSPRRPPVSGRIPPRTPWRSAWTSGRRSTSPKWPASSVSSRTKPASGSAGVRRPRLGPAPACGRVPLRNVREKLAAARESALDDPAPRQRRGAPSRPPSRSRPS